jgi:hypothetical protein
MFLDRCWSLHALSRLSWFFNGSTQIARIWLIKSLSSRIVPRALPSPLRLCTFFISLSFHHCFGLLIDWFRIQISAIPTCLAVFDWFGYADLAIVVVSRFASLRSHFLQYAFPPQVLFSYSIVISIGFLLADDTNGYDYYSAFQTLNATKQYDILFSPMFPSVRLTPSSVCSVMNWFQYLFGLVIVCVIHYVCVFVFNQASMSNSDLVRMRSFFDLMQSDDRRVIVYVVSTTTVNHFVTEVWLRLCVSFIYIRFFSFEIFWVDMLGVFFFFFFFFF